MLPVSEGWERFHPLTPLFSTGRLVFFGLLIGAQQLPDVGGDRVLLFALGAFLLLSGGAAVYSYLSWRCAGFRLDGDQLEVRKGILFKSQGNVPIARIESVDVAQRALPRVFGLAEVTVEVASQGGSEAELQYLTLAGANDLRGRLDAARRARTVGLRQDEQRVDASPASPRVTIAVVTDRDLIYAYGAGPAVAAAALVVVAIVVVAVSGLAALFAFGIFGVLGIVTALVAQVRRVDRLYGFTLSRDDEELHIQRGFVEKLTQQIPMSRIQAIRIVEPWIWRRFGRARLQVSVAGYRGSADARAAASAILMPIAHRDEIDRLVQSLGGPLVTEIDTVGPPPSARWRAPIRWRHTTVGHVPGFTIARRGWLRRETDFVTAAKLQSLRTSAGPWQRRLGLTTLHLDTAGPGIAVTVAHLAADEATTQLHLARTGAIRMQPPPKPPI